MNSSLDEYLRQIERHLHPLDPLRRVELLLELRHHLEDSMAHLSKKGGDEDDRIRSAIARMGPPDEIGRALVEADRPRLWRHAFLAILPYALLALAGVIDFKTAHNHSFVTMVFLLSLGVSVYFWGQSQWPIWSASWAGFASILPLAMIENGQVSGTGNALVVTLFFPLVALNFFKKQSLGHALLAFGGVVWIVGFIVLRISQFSSGLAVIGLVPMLIIVYVLRKYTSRRASMQFAQ